MSLELINQQIIKFLSSSEAEVMAIKGPWGVGKTYTWSRILENAKNDSGIAFEKYSYVSLFGVNSLDTLKFTIFENTVPKAIAGDKVSLETFKGNFTGVLSSLGRRSTDFIRMLPAAKNLAPAIESLSFLSLSEVLICIDDLERKGNGLDTKDVMGLVSHLKEQKKCKVVLLLNDGESGIEDYKIYREKVLDYEVTFTPTPEECASIAFDEGDKDTSRLQELSAKLKITNIRVLHKIHKLLQTSLHLVDSYEPEIRDQLIHTIVLFMWSYYCSKSDKEIPPLEQLCNRGFTHIGIGKDDRTEEEKKWNSILSDYNYTNTDPLDLVIADAVRCGYFNEEIFHEKAKEKNEEILASKAEGSFSKAWGLYHDSFDENDDQVISGLYDSFMATCKHVSPLNLNGLVTLLRELDENAKATEVIKQYIEVRGDEVALFETRRGGAFFGDKIDDEVKQEFDAHIEKNHPMPTPLEVLQKIAGKNGWDEEDEVVLLNTTSNQYYDLFKSIKGPELSSYVNTCLKFGRFSNATEQQRKIGKNAEDALRRIANESELNKRRVRKFDIE